MVGSDAIFEWTYPKAILSTDLSSVKWTVENKTDRQEYGLLLDNLDGTVTVVPTIPLLYKNRVIKTKQATLVIKSITFDDSTRFKCTLYSKTDPSLNKESRPVELIVTGTSLFMYSSLLRF